MGWVSVTYASVRTRTACRITDSALDLGRLGSSRRTGLSIQKIRGANAWTSAGRCWRAGFGKALEAGGALVSGDASGNTRSPSCRLRRSLGASPRGMRPERGAASRCTSRTLPPFDHQIPFPDRRLLSFKSTTVCEFCQVAPDLARANCCAAAYIGRVGEHLRDLAKLAWSVLVGSRTMRISLRHTFIRVTVAGLLVAAAVAIAAACGGDDSRYGGEKSGSFQPRSGISWGN